ncbi:unnamed protein product [Onchocerca flexuosa]|uniref:Secreted protein n=1 Tax=Onchocerca flexuosa TaxID=387005 RepID=A0A183H080_9BILA|nr:unnamed protein product [Onchocerca flexuosa]
MIRAKRECGWMMRNGCMVWYLRWRENREDDKEANTAVETDDLTREHQHTDRRYQYHYIPHHALIDPTDPSPFPTISHP